MGPHSGGSRHRRRYVEKARGLRCPRDWNGRRRAARVRDPSVKRAEAMPPPRTRGKPVQCAHRRLWSVQKAGVAHRGARAMSWAPACALRARGHPPAGCRVRNVCLRTCIAPRLACGALSCVRPLTFTRFLLATAQHPTTAEHRRRCARGRPRPRIVRSTRGVRRSAYCAACSVSTGDDVAQTVCALRLQQWCL